MCRVDDAPRRIRRNARAHLGHEIGHIWTNGAGPAANFLREGWARYVESLVLEHEFGLETERRFWRENAQRYFKNYDGRRSILTETFNSDLHYDKGSWIFRMLEEAVGAEAFRKAMTDYSRRSLSGSATWETLAECFQRAKPDFDAIIVGAGFAGQARVVKIRDTANFYLDHD